VSGHRHHHDDHHDGHHHHDGPLESITHVHGGAMVLDIGGSVGALHVVLDEAWEGRELFLGTDDPGFSVHTGVWLRHVDGEHVASALFPALDAGAYRVLGGGGEALATVHVDGGAVAQVDLSTAVGAAPGGTVR
jgi:hypothetical protein